MAKPSYLVMFDLNGTLVDTVPDITLALGQTLSERILPPLTEDQVRTIIGAGAETLLNARFLCHAGFGNRSRQKTSTIYVTDIINTMPI